MSTLTLEIDIILESLHKKQIDLLEVRKQLLILFKSQQKEAKKEFAEYCCWHGWTLSTDKKYWFNDSDEVPNRTTDQLYDNYINDQLFVSED